MRPRGGVAVPQPPSCVRVRDLLHPRGSVRAWRLPGLLTGLGQLYPRPDSTVRLSSERIHTDPHRGRVTNRAPGPQCGQTQPSASACASLANQPRQRAMDDTCVTVTALLTDGRGSVINECISVKIRLDPLNPVLGLAKQHLGFSVTNPIPFCDLAVR